jgi:UDP-N-acetylmuramate--alanine ligase
MNGLIDLSTKPAIHVIGCGGTGMAPITAVLAHMGLPVSGSDQRSSEILGALADLGVAITVGADFESIADDALIVRSTAVPDTHPEVAAALHAKRPVFRRADVLAAITAAYRTVAIAGTHGKTTTSSMTTAALLGAGVAVTSIVGGRILGVDQAVPGAVLGEAGGILVVEADESDGTFVELMVEVGVVTNIEPDHLEYYGGESGLFAAFDAFIRDPALRHAVVCGSDPGVTASLDRAESLTASLTVYGDQEGADVRLDFTPPVSQVEIGSRIVNVAPQQPGVHNALNMTGALAVVDVLGLDTAAAAAALSEFKGVGRRFERRGSRAGVEVVDDYAHLHGEIQAAIRAARQVCTGRVHVAFQPHRYSRTEALWQTYADALATADSVVLTDVYSSGESPRPGITSDLIFDDLRRVAPSLPVTQVGAIDRVPAALAAVAASGDLCLLLSAGDLPTVAERVLEALESDHG